MLSDWLRNLRFVCFAGSLITGVVASAQAVSEQYVFSHLAGPRGGWGNADGNGADASFNGPNGVAADAAGNVYVADTGNHAIRKVTPSGAVTTLYRAKSLSFYDTPLTPNGLAVDANGVIYVVDQSNNAFKIRKISPGGDLTSFADYGLGDSYDGGLGLAVDRAGYVYYSSTFYHTIGKFTPDGVVSILAGSKNLFGSTDGTGSNARFNFPGALALDNMGNVFAADTGNKTIRMITPAGVVTTLAGMAGQAGSTDGIGTAARFDEPFGLAVDAAGNIYVGETRNNTVRKITPGGVVTTLAGTTGISGSADGTGTAARFDYPTGLAVNNTGIVVVADGNNDSIRRITAAGVVTTLAGAAGATGSADGTSLGAQFNDPRGPAVDRAGNIYVADWNNHTIRKITPSGAVSTLAGKTGQPGGVDGSGAAAQFNHPNSVAVDVSGNIYVTDEGNTVRKITPEGAVSTVAGSYGQTGNADGNGVTARFNGLHGVAVDSGGNLYVADSMNQTIRKITPAGNVTTLAGAAGVPGDADGIGAAARFLAPAGVAVDAAGNVYVTSAPGQIPPNSSFPYPPDWGNTTVRKITPSGEVTTLAGGAGQQGEADGIGPAARFDGLNGLAVDRAGNVFVSEARGTVRKITPAGVVTTLAGSTVRGHANGIGQSAQFNGPIGVAIDDTGNLYVADSGNNAIRKGVLARAPVISTQPLSQTVVSGGSVQFSVTASGVPDPTYQWYFNGSAFSDATGSSLSFSNARPADAGDYTVVVANSLGSVTSAKATLTVNTASAPPPSSGSGGGGGGAPSVWFLATLVVFTTARLLRHQGKGHSSFAPK